MHRRWKIAGASAGTGVIVAAAIIGWLKLGPQDEGVVNSDGGTIALETESAPTPTPDPLALKVTEAGEGSVQGTAPAGSREATPAPRAPEPADFKQYEQYRDDKTALFADITAGQGPEAVMGSKLSVYYKGWLTDGRLFDETRGTVFSFVMGERRVIAGWEQGLIGMKVGGKRRLIVPPAAGYGSEANGPIPGGSVLVFDVELHEVK